MFCIPGCCFFPLLLGVKVSNGWILPILPSVARTKWSNLNNICMIKTEIFIIILTFVEARQCAFKNFSSLYYCAIYQ